MGVHLQPAHCNTNTTQKRYLCRKNDLCFVKLSQQKKPITMNVFVTISALIASILTQSYGLPMPMPQNRFLPFQPPQVNNQQNLGSQAALIGSALPLAFVGFNVLRGDTDLSVSPQLGVNVDPATGQLRPNIQADVQVGNDNVVNPTINLGAQLGGNTGGLPFTPTVGTGVNIGDASKGPLTGNIGANAAITDQGLNPQFGGGASIGALNFGNPLSFFAQGR